VPLRSSCLPFSRCAPSLFECFRHPWKSDAGPVRLQSLLSPQRDGCAYLATLLERTRRMPSKRPPTVCQQHNSGQKDLAPDDWIRFSTTKSLVSVERGNVRRTVQDASAQLVLTAMLCPANATHCMMMTTMMLIACDNSPYFEFMQFILHLKFVQNVQSLLSTIDVRIPNIGLFLTNYSQITWRSTAASTTSSGL